MRMLYIKFFFALFFSLLKINAQTTIPEIDSLQKKTFTKLLMKGNFSGVVSEEEKFIKISRRLNYEKGEIRGYINIANALESISRNKESLKFLEIAEIKLKKLDDVELLSYLYYVYGTNYYSMGLHEQAIKSFNKALEFARKINNAKERERRIYTVYDWKRSSFEFLGMMDSVYSNERKCMKSPMPMLFITIADRHFKNQRIDSAEYYIDMANKTLLTKKNPLEGKANVLRAYGRLCIEKKEYSKALSYLLSSLKITKDAHLKKRDLESYKLIANAYAKLNNLEKENEYLLKYSKLNDSLHREEEAVVSGVVEQMLNNNNNNMEDLRKKNYNLYYIIIGLILINCIIIYFINNSFKNQQKQKDALINQQVRESLELKKKLENSDKELIQLVISSDPSFMCRFKELYTDFYDNLTSKYSNLSSKDIKLCALIKLNLSNKQIAEYNHVSLRTVESSKYRLRKKLELSEDIDFNKWVMSH